jgi:hypothetical protein
MKMKKPHGESERGFLGAETSAMTEAARRAGSATAGAMRDLMAMGEFAHAGGKAMAAATLIARTQDWQLKPLMDALETLSKVKDWDHSWLVAQEIDGSPSFNWRDAPSRRYASFQDFYDRELAPTWGQWDRLVETWRRVRQGEISEGEAVEGIRLSAETREAIRAAKELPPLPKSGGDRRSVRFQLGDPSPSWLSNHNNIVYFCRRLARDYPDIFAALERGKYNSVHDALIVAGLRKRKKNQSSSMGVRLRYAWKYATPEQRAQFLAEIGAAMKD